LREATGAKCHEATDEMNVAAGGTRAAAAIEPSLGNGSCWEDADGAGQIPGFSSEFAVGQQRAAVNGCSCTWFVRLRRRLQ